MKKKEPPAAMGLNLSLIYSEQLKLTSELLRIKKSLKLIDKQMNHFTKFIDCRMDDGK